MIKSKVLLLTVFSAALLAQTLVAAEAGYDQKMDVVYGEVHGTGLLMDVFTPKGKPNGLAIIDVVSGAYRSDRSKIRDHTLAQVYTIFLRPRLCGVCPSARFTHEIHGSGNGRECENGDSLCKTARLGV